VQDVNDLKAASWLMFGLEWKTALLTTPLIRGADVSMPAFEPQKDILNIHRNRI